MLERRISAVMMGGVLALAACQASASPTPPATAPSSPSAPPTEAATSSPAPTPTATPVGASPAIVTEKTAVSEVSVHGTGESTSDIVALGDSNVAGWAVGSYEAYTPSAAFPGIYADRLAAEQGQTVVLHSYFPDQMGNEIRTVAQWADVLAADEKMRGDLGRARKVIVLVGYHDVIPILLFGACGSSWPDPLRDCLKQATDAMPAAFDRLYGDIESLVPADATILVPDYGIPAPLIDQWSSEPYWPELKQAMFGVWRDALEASAETHGATVVHTYPVLNGPNGDAAPGHDLTSDGWHFNPEGHRLLADLVLATDSLEHS